MGLKTYLDFAENDYNFFEVNYKSGIVANSMGAIAQNTCERYLKHIISTFSYPQNKQEICDKENILKAHNLNVLMKYLKNQMGIQIPSKTSTHLKEINGYYFNTRYPGDFVDELDQQDIETCYKALVSCRQFILNLEKQLQTQLQVAPLNELDMEREEL